MLFSLVSPARASGMDCDTTYIPLASIIGCIATGASLIGWYVHQRMLKEDRLRQRVILLETTNQLNSVLATILPEFNSRSIQETRFGLPPRAGHRRLPQLPQAVRPVEQQPPVYSRPPSYQEPEELEQVGVPDSLVVSLGGSRISSPAIEEEA